MIGKFTERHKSTEDGTPNGGQTYGLGFVLNWQKGPLGRGPDRQEPNGVFVETVIAAAAGRLEFYQASRFACEENAKALEHLKAALEILDSRTKKREERGVEGTHAV